MSEDELAEIVRLFPEADEHDAETPALRQERPVEQKHCQHRYVLLDAEARRITCRTCKVELDPFSVIDKWAREWDSIVVWRKEAERRTRLARERLEEILRLERNARARVRRVDPELRLPEKPWGQSLC